MSALSVCFRKTLGEFRLAPKFEADKEIVVLLGPSGSGKTLTLRAVAGLLTPDSGRILLPGGPVFDSDAGTAIPPWQRGVGYVVQNLALFPHMSVAENIGFGLQNLTSVLRKERVAELMEELGLNGLGSRAPSALSGGQQQRVALGRALAARPNVLLLDEPFSALDPPLRAQLRRLVMKLQRSLGLTTLFVTHDLAEAYAMADQIAVFDEGLILQFGPRADVFGSPRSVRVAELLEARNIFPGRVVARDDHALEIETEWFRGKAHADADLDVGDPAALCVRPEHVILQEDERGAVAGTTLEVAIEEVISTAGSHRLYARLMKDSVAQSCLLEIDLADFTFQQSRAASRRNWRVTLLLDECVAIPL